MKTRSAAGLCIVIFNKMKDVDMIAHYIFDSVIRRLIQSRKEINTIFVLIFTIQDTTLLCLPITKLCIYSLFVSPFP